MKKLALYLVLAFSVVMLLITDRPVLAQGNCDSSYPDVCIASPPPDLDCKDISYRNFQVVGDDPHHFDRDKDGIGCEP